MYFLFLFFSVQFNSLFKNWHNFIHYLKKNVGEDKNIRATGQICLQFDDQSSKSPNQKVFTHQELF